MLINYKKKKQLKTLPDYRFLGCPLTKNNTPWCFALCEPDNEGIGECGRTAPHSMKSRIQKGIDDYKMSKEFKSQFTKELNVISENN